VLFHDVSMMRRIPRTVLYGLGGLVLGAALTLGGYVVDYYNVYGRLPSSWSPGLVQGLHAITPVHYFADLFALILAVVAGVAGWFHDRTLDYSTGLERQVRARTMELAHSKQRYALAAEGSNDGIWDWDLVSDEVHYSPRWKSMAGCGADEVGRGPHEWFDRIHPDDIVAVRGSIREHLEQRTRHLRIEYRLRHQDGSYRWMLARAASLRDPSGSPVRLAGSQTDIHELRSNEEQLRHLAIHDRLTGLPNRTLLSDRLERLLQRRKQDGTSVAVLCLGVDRFRRINDSLGPTVGDGVLREIGSRLQAEAEGHNHESLPEGGECSVFRLEGDEFAVVFERVPFRRQGAVLAERMLRCLQSSMEIEGRTVRAGVSVGVAMAEAGATVTADLLRDAQAAMNQAKVQGGGRVHVFSQHMHAPARAALDLETELFEALEQGHLRLWYQPVVHLKSQAIAGFEALLRWEHPTRGIIPPGDFVPLAEETGLITAISRSCFHEGFARLREWQAAFPDRKSLAVKFNVSPRWLHHPDLEQDLVSLVEATGVEPSRVHLEITESCVIDCSEEILRVLKSLKRRGFLIALDDFGTGYSSLSMLHHLPLDMLKLDKSFVSRLTRDPEADVIARTIIALAHQLGLDVVAEGIETRAQLDCLRSMKCCYGQGFLFGRALRAGAAERLLRTAVVPAKARAAAR
jgi:diguanylate cyclase (GGDEF)-like protein/PAS domain S-box-containing protein